MDVVDSSVVRNETSPQDIEKENPGSSEQDAAGQHYAQKKSVYASLGWLDRLLVLWILLAIIVGILLGNFVDGVESALQKGKFVNVSVPIGMPHGSLTCYPTRQSL